MLPPVFVQILLARLLFSAWLHPDDDDRHYHRWHHDHDDELVCSSLFDAGHDEGRRLLLLLPLNPFPHRLRRFQREIEVHISPEGGAV